MSILATVKSVVLAQDCLLCGGAAGAELICRHCDDTLPRLPESLCQVCALPAPGNVCGACLQDAPLFDATIAGFGYQFPIDRLVQALKYEHRLALASWFATALARGPRPGGDIMLALPLSDARMAQRGFNQSLEIARPLARACGLPLLKDACLRPHDGPPQASLPWQARRRNVRGVFECRVDLSGKAAIVVDDVMTTGATLNEFARTLKKHGATRVTNWVAARALKH